MRKALTMLAVWAFVVAPASAQRTGLISRSTFFGCGLKSCHTLVAEVFSVVKFSAYGREFDTEAELNWTHTFTSFTAVRAYGGYQFNRPFTSGFLVDRFWDSVGWNSPTFCFIPDFARTCTDRSGPGTVETGWTPGRVGVWVLDAPDDWMRREPPSTFVPMNLVPEPSTYVLMLTGILVLGLTLRRRA